MNKKAILLIITILIGCTESNNPDTHANQFMTYLKDGKHLAVQEYLSKDMSQLATLLGGVNNESLKPYYRKGKILDYMLIQTEKTKTAIRYTVNIKGTDGITYQDTLDIKIEDGKWKVSGF